MAANTLQLRWSRHRFPDADEVQIETIPAESATLRRKIDESYKRRRKGPRVGLWSLEVSSDNPDLVPELPELPVDIINRDGTVRRITLPDPRAQFIRFFNCNPLNWSNGTTPLRVARVPQS